MSAAMHSREDAGFTLIEVLVVMLIVGILAGIALPQFLAQSAKANDAKVKSELHSALTAVDACYAESAAYRRCLDAAEDTGLPGPAIAATAGDGPVTLTQASRSGNTFTIVRHPPGSDDRTCTDVVSGKGGCPAGGGDW
jgi:type IV pilus assembly protein PilA